MKKILARILLIITTLLTGFIIIFIIWLGMLPYYIITGKMITESIIIGYIIDINLRLYEYSKP